LVVGCVLVLVSLYVLHESIKREEKRREEKRRERRVDQSSEWGFPFFSPSIYRMVCRGPEVQWSSGPEEVGVESPSPSPSYGL
jgi:hypothetical protein